MCMSRDRFYGDLRDLNPYTICIMMIAQYAIV